MISIDRVSSILSGAGLMRSFFYAGRPRGFGWNLRYENADLTVSHQPGRPYRGALDDAAMLNRYEAALVAAGLTVERRACGTSVHLAIAPEPRK